MPYIGEIRMFAGNFAPAGWAFCNGQPLPISENEALFQLIGTQYGGDGESVFNLPNLGARVPVMSDYGGGGWGQNWVFGQMSGTESVTLTVQQIPVHDHAAFGTVNDATSQSAGGNVPATTTAAGTARAYGVRPPISPLDPTSITPAGGNQPHDNMQPYQVVSFIISLFGIFPSPS